MPVDIFENLMRQAIIGRAWRPLVVAGPLASLAVAHCASSRNDLSDTLPASAIPTFLKHELDAVRADMGTNAPKVAISTLQHTHKLAFAVPHDARDKVLHAFVTQVHANDTSAALEVVPSSSAPPSLDYVFTDGSGSVQVRNDHFVLFKDEPMTKGDLVAFAAAYRASSGAPCTCVSRAKALEDVAKLGLVVYDGDGVLTWDSLAGYDAVKAEIQDTVVLALQNPALYDAIAERTRCRYESNRPRAILLEGPPGTGKTLSARIVASQAGIPLIHIPIESLVSKWYGESEKKMAAIFDAVDQLDGALIFIDEIDALATERGSGNMHEATRRMLSVLLQKLEGFQSAKKVTLIAATNRKQDLDAALLSRFNLCIRYDLPDDATRAAVFQRYAKQLSPTDLNTLAHRTNGKSCRDIKEICEYTERKWASTVLRKKQLATSTPNVDAYIAAIDATTPASAFVDI
ncbi:hypothetical protein SDRG_06081 [Saprolegnia diclina VS20]|uniref:AAA+ ATPase domain-containing protein n=1 Tax=Saprolegnia diclina (strain VS20) TaxID=1156394 RepID=T0RVX9_SAPDV|nr:hypothetical protein SDRG_06081 [Saprolegnia diclina VS20]EQC36643.1 hypothetical protein SDRG_06081 [Saprolegnia diclina VS20]|eukprot:XP_008610064.1 hypothetical protein SDRG_06081 [Saprolegnia diclina VS20]